ncbi:RNA polymerase sigma factor [Brevundimonas pondensis]|jgi:RNA polymerase sigma factor (sigma-70 family)|uniref:RNA polymerase sigma factor n=1 Tax=Brevundimonas pondensis TaxID=2774189 RepID=A0ABX7SJA1_9CAUL|nr:RNA polymerase sigma factor [Brevundimonas pondensis]QTC87449.1 RNA polymerase sigma factor [Brevundimonas pondensis]
MVDDKELKAWFFREVFPHEAALTRFIRRNWRNESDVADLRQDIYAKIYTAARRQLPLNPRAFLFTTARNHLINTAKRAKIVSFDLVADLETAFPDAAAGDLDQQLTAREELRRVQAGLARLPPRCRQVMTLRRIEGLSTREVAAHLDISVSTVEQQMVHGLRALADYMMGGQGRVRRAASKTAASKSELPS